MVFFYFDDSVECRLDLVCRTESTIDESLRDKGFLGRCCIHEHERLNICFVVVESSVLMYLDGGRRIVELFDHCLESMSSSELQLSQLITRA